jgi:heme/copper-type cytochrome/quinol oxidase subunit 1
VPIVVALHAFQGALIQRFPLAREVRLASKKPSARLSQRQLAATIGTIASLICRLEDADYNGHPLAMPRRIAAALNSHMLSVFSRKPVFGYRETVAAFVGIGALSFAVWGHHMFTTGMNPYMTMSFATLTMAISIPSAVGTFSWLGTIWRGRIEFRVPLLFALGFVSIFVTGGLSGLFLAQPSLDLYLRGTYFVVGHLHMVMGMAALFGIFSATYFWFPKMFGRMMNERLDKFISGSPSSAHTAFLYRCTSWG